MRAPAPPPLPVPSLLTPPTDLHPFPGPSPAFVAVLLLLGLLLLLTPVLADESADRSCGRGRARGAVFLVADGDTPWGCIQPIVDACADAPGIFDRIEFAVRSDASPERRVP